MPPLMDQSEVERVIDHYRMHPRPISSDGEMPVTTEIVGLHYDSAIEEFQSERRAQTFLNFGYWLPDTADQHTAALNLMREIAGGIALRTGRVLDVACGAGATTRFVSRHWPESEVWGINISDYQLSLCKSALPRAHFVRMDAGKMGFAGASFNALVCVEAAFHFKTRRAFFESAFQILTTGGTLALTDVLLHEEGHRLLPMWPKTNFVESPAAYRGLLKEIGFSCVEVRDITNEGWLSYARSTFATLHQQWLSGGLTFQMLQFRLREMYRLSAAIRYNIVCFATK